MPKLRWRIWRQYRPWFTYDQHTLRSFNSTEFWQNHV